MSIESIIGIVSGSIAIAGAVLKIIICIKNRHVTTEELFKRLVDKTKTDDDHRKALQKLNKAPLIGNRIKDDYIKGFVLGKRGPETVLFDLCDSNDIEPTDDVCKGLIGARMPSMMKRYQEKRK